MDGVAISTRLLTIEQVSQALQIIDNVGKISSWVCVNKNQCKRIADRFSVIGEGLKGSVGYKALDGSGSSNKDYPGFDDLFRVLRKGEALVSDCTGFGLRFSPNTSNPFQTIHEELDSTLDSQFHYDGNCVGFPSGVERSVMLTKDAERDRGEPERMVEAIDIGPGTTSVEEEIERSKSHWSELTDFSDSEGEDAVAVDIDYREVFKTLQSHPTWGFFIPTFSYSTEVWRSRGEPEVDKELAEGGHPELVHVPVTHMVKFSAGAEDESMSTNLRDLIQSRLGKTKLITATQNTSSQQLADVLPFDLRVAVLINQKIALEMQILHSSGIVHRDLKASNILVREHDPGHIDIKIPDFECSVGVVGTGFWRAPEILRTLREGCSNRKLLNLEADVFSSKTDVYSFGMTCYEILTGRVPCSELSSGDYDPVIAGYRPTLPSNLNPFLKVLIEQCWHCDPNQRPDFSYICEELQRIQQALDSLSEQTADWSKMLPGSMKMSDLIENVDAEILVEQHCTNIFVEQVTPAAALGVDPTALSDDDEPPRKRIRTGNWDAEETRALLEVTEEAPRVNWFYICEKLWEQHGFDRAATSCRGRWDAVLKSFNAIRDCELTNGWESDEDERSNHLIPEFDMEWCGVIERIFTKSFDKGTSSIQIDASDLSSPVDSELDEVDTYSEDEGLS